MTRAFTLNLAALSLLALMVGMFLIYNTMTFSVVRGATVIGHAAGARRHARGGDGAGPGEALLVGLVATALGLGLGVALAQGSCGW